MRHIATFKREDGTVIEIHADVYFNRGNIVDYSYHAFYKLKGKRKFTICKHKNIAKETDVIPSNSEINSAYKRLHEIMGPPVLMDIPF
jgi:hypothetical protein